MKNLTRRHTSIASVLLACAIAAVLYGSSLLSDFQLQSKMANEIHPVWQKFDTGQIQNGSDLSAFIKTHPPSEQVESGPFSELQYYDSSKPALYFSSLNITAKNGALVRASADSCTWNKVFFDSLSRADDVELQKLHDESNSYPLKTAP
jgi:hypothetical protein